MAEPAPKASPLFRTTLEAALGAVVGFAVWSLGGPAVIGWWYEPPSGDAFSCAGTVRTALTQFITMQLIFAACGAAGTAVLLFFVRRALKNRAAKSTTA